jgi:hypothetical protein
VESLPVRPAAGRLWALGQRGARGFGRVLPLLGVEFNVLGQPGLCLRGSRDAVLLLDERWFRGSAKGCEIEEVDVEAWEGLDDERCVSRSEEW